MELASRNTMFFIQVALVAIILHLHLSSATEFGAIYGLQGHKLPEPDEVIDLYATEHLRLMRLIDPNPDVLNALRGAGPKVAVGVHNEDVANIANDVNTAIQWVNTNIAPYASEVNFGWIHVGNDMIPGPGAELVSVAMNNILSGLNAAGITKIQVSTIVGSKALAASAPASLPSAGDFSNDAKPIMTAIINWLTATNNPLMINVDTYHAFVSDPSKVPSLNYAVCNPHENVVDGKNTYFCLFTALLDSFFAALEKVGGAKLTVVVAETGWPSAGNGAYTTKENAQSHNQGVVTQLKDIGTPRRLGDDIDVFISSMFNEDQRPNGVDQHWGLHYPNQDPVYTMEFPA